MQNRRLIPIISILAALCIASMVAVQAAKKPTARSHESHAKITAQQAEKVALKKYPGKIVEKTVLENEEGVWQYGVMDQSGKTLREIMVNAKTGKIDSVEITTAEKEGTEAAKERANEKGESGEREDNDAD